VWPGSVEILIQFVARTEDHRDDDRADGTHPGSDGPGLKAPTAGSRTAVLGCILVTGYLGGATATQVRAQDPWFLFPVVLGVLSWLGLYLRDARLRALLPIRT
jgi:hypothetical protein